jgi:hypothetical protein
MSNKGLGGITNRYRIMSKKDSASNLQLSETTWHAKEENQR